MRFNADCALCLLRRHIETARGVGTDEQVTAFTKDLMRLFADGPEDMAAPWFTPEITRLFTAHFGLADDRYAQEKQDSNRYFLERQDTIRAMIEESGDPLYAGLQCAILGNYIDFSALQGEVSFRQLDEMLPLAKTIDVDRAVFEALRRDLAEGRELLYLTDNAGEIGFDRLFLETIHRHFPALAITVCVRGGPTQNDATAEDAAVVGMPFPVIGNGTRIPGTVLSMASEELKEALSRATVIIAKGQANVETLLDTGHGYNIYYAFLVKCVRFIQRFGKEKLTPMLVHEKEAR
ncbi:MAG: DUF89 family protein [Oscillospiraceae bacterium]|nr:DUF89 family protein [Oscillospiraceae bacterium]